MEVLKNSTTNEGSFLAFSWSDYTIFIAMLVMSTLVGIYFGIFKKQDTTEKYLHGGKRMGVFPVSVSLLSRYSTNHFLYSILSISFFQPSFRYYTSRDSFRGLLLRHCILDGHFKRNGSLHNHNQRISSSILQTAVIEQF